MKSVRSGRRGLTYSRRDQTKYASISRLATPYYAASIVIERIFLVDRRLRCSPARVRELVLFCFDAASDAS